MPNGHGSPPTASVPDESEGRPSYDMVLVMGMTGSGKSFFINQLAKGTVRVGHSIHSETEECKMVKLQIGQPNDRSHIAVVDTPGFDDSKKSDAEILYNIAKFICAQYSTGIRLRGIIYMHRITDNRLAGNARRYLQMFQQICGKENFGNVVFLTTMWGLLPKGMEGDGWRRDRELRAEFRNVLGSSASQVQKFDGSKGMAESIIIRLMRQDPIKLKLQRELVDERKALRDTDAGKLIALRRKLPVDAGARSANGTHLARDLNGATLERRRPNNLENDMLRQKGPISGVTEERSKKLKKAELKQEPDEVIMKRKPGNEIITLIEDTKKTSKWKDGISIFASVVGVLGFITFQIILPVCGVSLGI